METKIIHIPNKAILTPADLIVPHRTHGSTEAALLELSELSKKNEIIIQPESSPVKVLDISQDEIKEMFERQFGADQDHRTKHQWNNLINQYGWEIVIEKEGMSKVEIITRMRESFTKRMKRLTALKHRQN